MDALQRALGLRPTGRSPLPYEITAIGTAEWEQDNLEPSRSWDEQWHTCIAMQRELLTIAGWPDCRSHYEDNLKVAVAWAAYCRKIVANPKSGGTSHADPKAQLAHRREVLASALETVAWRKELLVELKAAAKARG